MKANDKKDAANTKPEKTNKQMAMEEAKSALNQTKKLFCTIRKKGVDIQTASALNFVNRSRIMAVGHVSRLAILMD